MSKKYSILKKTLVFTIVILFIGMVVAPCISSINIESEKNTTGKTFTFNPFKEGWKYRKKITIDSDKVTGNLVNFPLLVSTVDSDLAGKAQAEGDDIIFMDDKGEAGQLFHEIESFDVNNGELIAWVNIPILSSAADLKIFMYYGNPDCTNQEFPDSVWDSYYCGVWHLNDFDDSTINGNDGVNHGTEDCPGKIGKGKDFVESNKDYISLGDMPEPADDSISTATFEIWINPEVGAWGNLICKLDTSYEPDLKSYNFNLLKTGEYRFSAQSGTWVPSDDIIRFTTNEPLVTTNTWQQIVIVVDLSVSDAGSAIIYFNGEIQPSNTIIIGSPPDHFYDVPLEERLGRYTPESGGPHLFDGSMDEVRISKVCRSQEWISTQFNNQNDVSSFLKFGREIRPRSSTNENILIQRFFENHPNILIILKLIFGLN
jgi:hypothetical protein